jgi:hypothetical protein
LIWAINESLDSIFGRKSPDLLTIPLSFINIVNDIGLHRWPNDNKIIQILYSEKPGEIARGLTNIEIAALLYELVIGEKVRPIALSYVVFDLCRGKSLFDDDRKVDNILRDSYDLLPEDDEIIRYTKNLYARIADLLRGHVAPPALMTYQEFSRFLSIEKIKQQAVFWEYNLILGELEEMLRDFISSDEVPPYVFQFEKRWNEVFPIKEAYWNDTIRRFQELCFKVANSDSYTSALKCTSGFRHDLQGWFEIVRQQDGSNVELKDAVHRLLMKASEIGDSLEFDAKLIRVNFLPTPINPLITRGAVYSWLRVFAAIWE